MHLRPRAWHSQYFLRQWLLGHVQYRATVVTAALFFLCGTTCSEWSECSSGRLARDDKVHSLVGGADTTTHLARFVGEVAVAVAVVGPDGTTHALGGERSKRIAPSLPCELGVEGAAQNESSACASGTGVGVGVGVGDDALRGAVVAMIVMSQASEAPSQGSHGHRRTSPVKTSALGVVGVALASSTRDTSCSTQKRVHPPSDGSHVGHDPASWSSPPIMATAAAIVAFIGVH